MADERDRFISAAGRLVAGSSRIAPARCGFARAARTPESRRPAGNAKAGLLVAALLVSVGSLAVSLWPAVVRGVEPSAPLPTATADGGTERSGMQREVLDPEGGDGGMGGMGRQVVRTTGADAGSKDALDEPCPSSVDGLCIEDEPTRPASLSPRAGQDKGPGAGQGQGGVQRQGAGQGPRRGQDQGRGAAVATATEGKTGGRAESLGADLVVFVGLGCPHCEEATPFLETLKREMPGLRLDVVEVRANADGRARFLDTMDRLNATAVGIPAFVIGDQYVVGYAGRVTEDRVRELLRSEGGCLEETQREERVTLPLLGALDPGSASLPALTVAIGLADGVNPCAMWVLIVLLGILVHVRSPSRMLAYASIFVFMSGFVYFLFMTAWSVLFAFVGFSRWATAILGAGLLGMGLINIKDLFWFKKGLSLVIPETVKPALYRRMRGIAGAASAPAAVGGLVILAFVVNLVELGCTLGLPAAYTRILSLRGVSTGARVAYLVLYNIAYIVPLAVIVLAFAAARRKIVLQERGARILKGVSGLLLTLFGATFLFAPGLLVGE